MLPGPKRWIYIESMHFLLVGATLDQRYWFIAILSVEISLGPSAMLLLATATNRIRERYGHRYHR